MKPETKFRVRVRTFFNTLKHTVAFPIQQQSFHGHPDYILCCRGWFIAVELKSEKGIASPLQDFILDKVRTKGFGLAVVVHPENWLRIKTWLKAIDKGELHERLSSNDVQRTTV